jgi:hypothetical protein
MVRAEWKYNSFSGVETFILAYVKQQKKERKKERKRNHKTEFYTHTRSLKHVPYRHAHVLAAGEGKDALCLG